MTPYLLLAGTWVVFWVDLVLNRAVLHPLNLIYLDYLDTPGGLDHDTTLFLKVSSPYLTRVFQLPLLLLLLPPLVKLRFKQDDYRVTTSF